MTLRRLWAAFCLLAVAALLVLLQIPASFAADAVAAAGDGTITVPIGSWVGESAGIVATVLAAVVAWGLRFLPASILQILRTAQAEQLLDKAINYGVNAVADATRDKTLSVNVGNAVVAQALQYAIDHGPGWMIGWLGGEAAIRQKIIARLNLEAAAAVAIDGTSLVKAGQG